MKFGFCCKYITSNDQINNGVKQTDDSYQYNIGTTTVSFIKRLSPAQLEDKLQNLITRNILSVKRLVSLVASDIPEKRMLRLSSDILPLYTHPSCNWYYKLKHVQDFLQKTFGEIGHIAKAAGVRLSFHPGQFIVLSSDRAEVIVNSIKEFEYHCDMVRWMNYGNSFQDMKVNIHLSGKGGSAVFRSVYHQLSFEARNCITVENDEYSSSLEDCLKVSDIVPIVFDIHHEWINNGNILEPDSDDIKRVIDSWRGVRPVMHFSQSKDYLFNPSNLIGVKDLSILLRNGLNKSMLRAHSDFYWNKDLNQKIKEFSNNFDIQCECKAKNLGRDLLYKELFQA